jgi:hypothetical protein
VGPTLYASIDVALNTIEVAALLYLLGRFLYLRRDITALLRVIRRIDRSAAAITARGSNPAV